MIIVLIIGLVMLALSVFLLFRNESVYAYRTQLLNDVSLASRGDIQAGRNWQWRYLEYDNVTYMEMVFKFWLPLDSFYPDQRFTEMTGRE